MMRMLLLLLTGLALGCRAEEPTSLSIEIEAVEVSAEGMGMPVEAPILTGTGWAPPAVIVMGPVDEDLTERARLWSERNLAIPVPRRESVEEEGVTLEDAAHQVSALVGEKDAGLVALVWTREFYTVHGFMWPDNRVVIINIRTLMADNPDEETLGRRVERQVIRGVCMLLGLEYSPNPMSAMWGYSNLEELDQMGRNLDPPWLRKLQERALELGIPLDEDNPFFILR
ncbi:MAG TPA: hypothetical protein PKE55_11830 [Kiritimatiellia bacterium]|nr:hypothetical protein [Kiritimatiellia bacterium]